MYVRYDFDIQWLVPREVEVDPALHELFAEMGRGSSAHGKYVAMFRDADALAQIDRADPALRNVLKSSGFGFSPSKSELPPGIYALEDAPARGEVIARLGAKLARGDLAGPNLAGFDVTALLNTAAMARPMSEAEAQDVPPETDVPDAPSAPAARPSVYANRTAENVLRLMIVALIIMLSVLLFAGRNPAG